MDSTKETTRKSIVYSEIKKAKDHNYVFKSVLYMLVWELTIINDPYKLEVQDLHRKLFTLNLTNIKKYTDSMLTPKTSNIV